MSVTQDTGRAAYPHCIEWYLVVLCATSGHNYQKLTQKTVDKQGLIC